MSQRTDILDHLRGGKSITPLEALAKFGCFRLADVIWKLRREGYAITTEMWDTPQGARVARYWMGGKA